MSHNSKTTFVKLGQLVHLLFIYVTRQKNSGSVTIYEISDIETVTSAARLSKYCFLIIISHTKKFIYYLYRKCAEILQYDML